MRVPEGLLTDLLPGPVTLVMERSEALNKDLNPFTPVSQIFSCVPRLLPLAFTRIQARPIPHPFQPFYDPLSPAS